jgi:hypothetical protein
MVKILLISLVVLLLIYLILLSIRYHIIKKTEYYISFTENLIEENEWKIYRYRFLKKLIHIQILYNSKFEDKENLIPVVENSEMFKQNIGLSYSMFFSDKITENINIIVEENRVFFDNLFKNDGNLLKNELLIKEFTNLLSELKKSRIDF